MINNLIIIKIKKYCKKIKKYYQFIIKDFIYKNTTFFLIN